MHGKREKYIEKPFLYKGRKFDVRIWVLLAHNMKVYVFKEGHLKATSSLFSLLFVFCFNNV